MTMRLRLVLLGLALIAGGIAHEAFARNNAKPKTVTQTLTPEQRAARKKLLATAAFLKQHNLSCGCRHHFPAPKGG
jgi:hypothetical protein